MTDLTLVYAYQGAITSVLFNGRTRALVSLLTGLGSMVGSIIIGLLTDRLPFKRRNRALCSCLIVFLLTGAVWGAGLGFQVQFTRATVTQGSILEGSPLPWDLLNSSSAAGPMVLLMACESLLPSPSICETSLTRLDYIADATYQGLAYYTMSAMTNGEPHFSPFV